MLTDNDNENKMYSSKEAYLSGLRSKRSQTNDGTSSSGDTIRRAIQRDEGDNRENDGERRTEKQVVPGTNGSSQDTAGYPEGFTEQLRQFRNQSTGSDSSSNQHLGRATEAVRKPRWSVGSIVGKYKEAVQRPQRTVEAGKKKTASTEGKKLSDAEVIRLRPKLVEYLTWQTEHLDQFIIATSGGHDPTIEIWGTMSIDEMEILADFLLQMGKTDVKAATAVRYASVLMDRVKLGLIIVPRMYHTLAIYWQRGVTIR